MPAIVAVTRQELVECRDPRPVRARPGARQASRHGRGFFGR